VRDSAGLSLTTSAPCRLGPLDTGPRKGLREGQTSTPVAASGHFVRGMAPAVGFEPTTKRPSECDVLVCVRG
jgi:hypothetical protein